MHALGFCPDLLYFEDLSVGQSFVTDAVVIEQEHANVFRSLVEGSDLPLAAAENERVATIGIENWLVGALSASLMRKSGPRFADAVEAGGAIEWGAMARAGDSIYVECLVLSVMPSQSASNRGTIVLRCETKTSQEQIVQTFELIMSVACRTALARH